MNKIFNPHVAVNLKRLRLTHNYTQQQVSEALSISRSAYCLIELGHRTIPTDVLINLAIFYNVSVDEILKIILYA